MSIGSDDIRAARLAKSHSDTVQGASIDFGAPCYCIKCKEFRQKLSEEAASAENPGADTAKSWREDS